VTRHAPAAEEPRDEPHRRPPEPAPREVVHDDALAGHRAHRFEICNGGGRLEVMQGQRGDGDVDRMLPEGRRERIGPQERDLGIARHRPARHLEGRLAQIEREHSDGPAGAARPAHEGAGDVAPARAEVDHGGDPVGG